MGLVASFIEFIVPNWVGLALSICLHPTYSESSIWPPINTRPDLPFPIEVVATSALLFIALITALLQLRPSIRAKRSLALIAIQLVATLAAAAGVYLFSYGSNGETYMTICGPQCFMMIGAVARQAVLGVAVTLGAGLTLWRYQSVALARGAKIGNLIFAIFTSAAWLSFVTAAFFCIS